MPWYALPLGYFFFRLFLCRVPNLVCDAPRNDLLAVLEFPPQDLALLIEKVPDHVAEVLIEGNHIHDFERSRLASDHADMIQFWTNGSSRPSVNIVIRGNVLDSGTGGATQSIFMRNEEVDRGRAGEEMFYRDILIEENVIINGHLHGITVGESRGLTIRNNTLLRNQAFAQGENRDRRVTIPAINIVGASQDVAILDNIADRFPESGPGRRVEGNLLAQDLSPMRPGYYHRLFTAALLDDPRDLENFVYLPEVGLGRAEGDWPGAALLRPGADRSAFRWARVRSDCRAAPAGAGPG